MTIQLRLITEAEQTLTENIIESRCSSLIKNIFDETLAQMEREYKPLDTSDLDTPNIKRKDWICKNITRKIVSREQENLVKRIFNDVIIKFNPNENKAFLEEWIQNQLILNESFNDLIKNIFETNFDKIELKKMIKEELEGEYQLVEEQRQVDNLINCIKNLKVDRFTI